jgi:iron(III) transport system ATP-binding protein
VVLRCRELAKSFGRTVALHPISFSVKEGERVAVSGPSGSGKTTLLRLLAGLERPTAGEILEGDSVVNSPHHSVPPWRRGVGMLFQNLSLWPHLRVREQLELMLPRPAGGRSGRRSRAREILAQVGLLNLEERYPAELSGGERQRVAWARAVASKPKLLLLDEPLTSLDPPLREDLLRLTEEYARAAGCTLILVTHDPAVACRIGESTLRLDRGG